MKNISMILFLCLFVPGLAHSLPIVYNFSGTIDRVGAIYPEEASFAVGDTFVAHLYYNYDSTVVGTHLGGDVYVLPTSGSQLLFNFGHDILFTQVPDMLRVGANTLSIRLGGGLNFTNKSYDTWFLDIEIPSLETPLNMMPTPEELSRITTAWFGTDYIQRDNNLGLPKDHVVFSATLTPLDNSSPVPEPGTLLLLGSGLVGLALYRRRMNKA